MHQLANALRVRSRDHYPGHDGLLENAADEIDRLADENEKLLARLAELAPSRKAALAESLAPAVEQVRADEPPRRGPGRPRKNPEGGN